MDLSCFYDEDDDRYKFKEGCLALIDRLDQNIGKILNKLEDTGKNGNTLIMFVSDNGASAETVNLKTDDDEAPIGSIARWVSLDRNWANVSNTPFRHYKSELLRNHFRTQ